MNLNLELKLKLDWDNYYDFKIDFEEITIRMHFTKFSYFCDSQLTRKNVLFRCVLSKTSFLKITINILFSFQLNSLSLLIIIF